MTTSHPFDKSALVTHNATVPPLEDIALDQECHTAQQKSPLNNR